MKNIACSIVDPVKDKKGQGMVEYALILGFVALCVVLALGSIPEPLSRILSVVTETLGLSR